MAESAKNSQIFESRKLELFGLEKIAEGTEVSGLFQIIGLEVDGKNTAI